MTKISKEWLEARIEFYEENLKVLEGQQEKFANWVNDSRGMLESLREQLSGAEKDSE